MLWLSILCSVLAIVIIVLSIKIMLLRKATKEIYEEFNEKLKNDTNTLICISSHDKIMRKLANEINNQLAVLRKERHRFKQGDTELKNAVTNISHDLRTPLTAICGYLDLLENTEKTETVGRYISIIKNRAELLKQLTDDLFRYSIIYSLDNSTNCEPVCLNSVLEESIAGFYASLSEKDITPNINITDIKIIRNLNKASLSRIFSNFLNNAIKYSDGDLDITLSNSGEIIFSNTASRLDEVQVGKLFDRFYTVEAARKSTGLGLSIAKVLVEQMNGSIHAKYYNSKLSIHVQFEDTNS